MEQTAVKRWVKISLRTLHLISVAGVGGGILFEIDKSNWLSYWWLALASGVLMMLIDILSNPVWMVQVRGIVIYVKLILLAFIGVEPATGQPLLFIIIIMSAVISHAPGKLRYYSVYHRKAISSRNDSKG